MNKLLFIALIFLSLETNSKYEWYECSNGEQAKRCASGCSKSIDVSRKIYDFKVNSNNNSVVMNYFDKDGKYLSSSAFNKCSVIDTKNWICSNGEDINAIMHESIFRFSFVKNQCYKDSF